MTTLYNSDLENEIRPLLSSNEKLLWIGKPKKGIVFQWSDIFVIPFTILWCGFAIFWETMAILGNAPIFFVVWGVPFVLVGLYMLVGRFWADKIRRDKTLYAITNERIIIKTGLFKLEINVLYIRNLSYIHFSENKDKTGNIYFSREENSFRNQLSPFRSQSMNCIVMVENVKELYHLITSQQK